jgi:glutamine synthetase
MSSPRFRAIDEVINRKPRIVDIDKPFAIEKFGTLTFNRAVMEKVLPKEAFANVSQAMSGRNKVNLQYADVIALAMKDWAISLGATHFTHWFQPMTGLAAEKHDAFIDWKSSDKLIEKFNGKLLLQGEPDASSFPSGGLRSTHEARGYTTWDPSSPAFLWQFGGTTVLCIPSVFYSWSGEALDMKIPLLRSDAKINQAALRLLEVCGVEGSHVYSTLGCEQEYFLIDRVFQALRPDLVMGGRTLLGAAPAKGQELEDHYFGTIKERVLAYMRECEAVAFQLGIPLKTRHGEVAPGQFEAAPVFEKASAAVDHNLLLMELMRQIATRHDLTCLFHEKPFAGINGSGKHNNWSLSTDKGMNLLDPTDNPQNHLLFLIMVAAVLTAVHRHAGLLRASIASAGNDHRLGGNEAPPAIISVYMGETLEKILTDIEEGKQTQKKLGERMDLGLPVLPDLPKDSTDRNRTSPFAFTGNKFEFRAVGASANCSFPVAVLNVIVAESLNEIVDAIEAAAGKKGGRSSLSGAALPIVRKYLKASRPIRFTGNNYSPEWAKEAKKRGLPIIPRSYDAFKEIKEKSVVKVFAGVLSAHELVAHYEIHCEHYIKMINIEVNLMTDMFRTQILPAAIEYQKHVAKSLHLLGKGSPTQTAYLKALSQSIDRAMKAVDAMEGSCAKAHSLSHEKKGAAFCHQVAPSCLAARAAIDELEKQMDDKLWPLPKYREMLFIL